MKFNTYEAKNVVAFDCKWSCPQIDAQLTHLILPRRDTSSLQQCGSLLQYCSWRCSEKLSLVELNQKDDTLNWQYLLKNNAKFKLKHHISLKTWNVLQSCIPGRSTERRPEVVLTIWFEGLFWSLLLEPIPVLGVLFNGSLVQTELIADTGLKGIVTSYKSLYRNAGKYEG